MQNSEYHPAVCPVCCKRAAVRRDGIFYDLLVDMAYVFWQWCHFWLGGVLLVASSVLLFIPGIFCRQRSLSKRNWDSLTEIKKIQEKILADERAALALRNDLLKAIAAIGPPRIDEDYRLLAETYAALDRANWQLDDLKSDGTKQKKLRLRCQYPAAASDDD